MTLPPRPARATRALAGRAAGGGTVDGMRVLFVNGLGGPYLDVVGYDDWQRPQGRVVYRGQLPATTWDWVTDADGVRWLAYELLNVADIKDVTE